jgi:hypothetical protein
LLLWSEFRTAAADSALPASIVEAGLGSFAKHSAFKLSKRTEHLHRHTPGRACGIDRFAQAPESSLCLGNVFYNGEDIAKGSARAGRASTLQGHPPFEAGQEVDAVQADPNGRRKLSRERSARILRI